MQELARESGEVPQALVARPRIYSHLRWIWDAFHELSHDRQTGFGAGPIPFTAIHFYAERRMIDDADEFERFNHLIRAMDRTWLDHARKDKKGK